ncbi:MAG TPA: DDE-type integrase/transposase/recombinase [Steroidobacteraceae bacterium]
MKETRTGAGQLASRGPHAQAAVIFGSAASQQTRRKASVRATCEAIGLPRSTYYYQSHRSAEAVAFEQRIVQRLLELRELYPDDGYRRMTLRLRSEGLNVNRKRIARLMHLHSLSIRTFHQDAGLRQRQVQTSTANQRDNFRPTAANQVWLADLAYARIRVGLIYAASIIDVWTREVVGYAVSKHINTRLPAIALHSAVRAHRPAMGCFHHSTCGMQYLTRGYRELLRQYGLIPVVRDAEEPPTVCASSIAHKIVDISGFHTWEDVSARGSEFIREVYSAERIGQILNSRARSGPLGTPTRSLTLL